MPTKFSDLYPLMRALVGDNDEQLRMFSDSVLDSHLRVVILIENSTEIQEQSNTRQFTTDLTPTQKALMVLRGARSVIAPIPNSISWKNPVTSGSRRDMVAFLIPFLEGKIEEVEGGGGMYIKSDSEMTAMLRGYERYLDEYADAWAST